MNSRTSLSRLDALLRDIDLPDHAYEGAENRYKDFGEWIAAPSSILHEYDAHVFVQGSFALGTAIRPVNPEEEYDLDFTCKLRQGVTRENRSQAELKELVGSELAAYRSARRIDKPLTEKKRCWRLSYKDKLPFHMDVVPGIPADEERRQVLVERMAGTGVERMLAQDIARRALWITDTDLSHYRDVGSDWPSSNPGGYQKWFLSRMRLPERNGLLAEAQVDPVPVFRSRTPLQQAVQLLKRHRDVAFAHDLDLKPASILITTVAGLSYRPTDSLDMALRRTLDALQQVRVSDSGEILNPINPNENFADRWEGPNCPLKINFYRWIEEVEQTFGRFLGESTPQRLLEIAEDHFSIKMSGDTARTLTGGAAILPAAAQRVEAKGQPPAPWSA
ncbi:nucleotidyltransferase domain-containing protein [Luteimonas sp. A277]